MSFETSDRASFSVIVIAVEKLRDEAKNPVPHGRVFQVPRRLERIGAPDGFPDRGSAVGIDHAPGHPPEFRIWGNHGAD